MAFLEERFPDDIHHGSGFVTRFAGEVIKVAGGNEYRSRRHPYLMAELEVEFSRQTKQVISRIIDLNMRAGGAYAGFRVRNPLDFSTKAYREAPTALDQPMVAVSAGAYQLMRWYGTPSDPECSRRRIRKPVAGSVKVGVAGAEFPAAQWSVDTTTGLVTMVSKTASIIGISKSAQAVIACGAHSFNVGESVVITGAAGMTQINGLRALVTANTGSSITVAINSSAFSTWTSGGTVQTQPAAGEAVTGGCYFDLPMRFDGDLSGTLPTYDWADVSGINLVEILNP